MKVALEKIMKNWVQATREQFIGHELAAFFKKEFQDEVALIAQGIDSTFKIKASVGAGNWANVPWLSILNPRITTSTQSGVYPVYLFKADGSGVYLSLNQGTTTPTKKFGKGEAIRLASQLSKDLLRVEPSLQHWIVGAIDLAASTPLGKSYESPNISAIYYPADSIPEDDVLEHDLKTMLYLYRDLEEVLLNGKTEVTDVIETSPLPKPFLLLAGISGTGKSRFVRQQAEPTRNPAAQQLIISVRPDWHEPSDLLGYVSRLRADRDQYIVTDALRFMFSAWQAAADFVEFSGAEINGARDDLASIPPFWLGLDEMNLAPVEQYFADYLSVIESRKWEWATDDTFTYSCEPLLSAEHCALIKDEKLRDAISPELWEHFEKYGMPIPFNLIVAGTVNMDETTHGFSRKVIDRALTVDYGEFAPNIFEDYFGSEIEPRVFSYPTLSSVTHDDLNGTCDVDGKKSIEFLNAINGVLKETPFELAYRALNELLISVACEKPQTHEELQAVWDDFLMTKVLPRIEGDADKLDKVFAKEKVEDKSDEPKLLKVVKEQLNIAERKDLFLQARGGGDKALIPLRSPAKIEKMVERLESAGFTSFWP